MSAVRNLDIRFTAQKSGVKLYEIADELGLCDSSFSRKLRKELSGEEKKQILDIIRKILSEG